MDIPDFLTKDTTWWLFTLPHFLGSKNIHNMTILIALLFTSICLYILTWVFTPGGIAWIHGTTQLGHVPIPGPRGLPIFGHLLALTQGLAHRTLATMAWKRGNNNKQLMAFSLGSTPVVVASDSQTAKDILTSSHFANRPLKQSVKSIMFERAIGFAPNGTYWRLLRRIASTHLFSPKRIASHEVGRQKDCFDMLSNIANEHSQHGVVCLRKHLQFAALNNIMGSVFGKRYKNDSEEVEELRDMVKEGFELLGAFNCCDYLPWLSYFYDHFGIKERCSKLVPRVRNFAKKIIEEHRVGGEKKLSDDTDFVDVLLSIDGEEKLQEDDMISVLWEMIFRGTDTTALLTEWVMAELVLHPNKQEKLFSQIDRIANGQSLTDIKVSKLPYLQAIIKETLKWVQDDRNKVDLSEVLKLSCEMKYPLRARIVQRDQSVAI